MESNYPYRVDHQLANYLRQITRAFSGFQVQYDSTTFRRVPVRYGNMSRMVATVLNKRDSLSSTALPTMAVHMTSLDIDTTQKRSHRYVDAVKYTEGGVEKSTQRLIGPAFIMNVDLDIYASSVTQMFEIMEQILLIFNPRVNIQTDNDIFNADYITELELTNIADSISYPLGTESRTVMMTLSFACPIRLRYPMDLDAPLIETIRARVFDESGDEPMDEFTVPEEA